MTRQLWVIFVLAITSSLLSGYLAGRLGNTERLGDCLRDRISCEAQAQLTPGPAFGFAEVLDRLFPPPEKIKCELTLENSAIFDGCLSQGKRLDTCKTELVSCNEWYATCQDNLTAHLNWDNDFGANDACIEAYERLRKSVRGD